MSADMVLMGGFVDLARWSEIDSSLPPVLSTSLAENGRQGKHRSLLRAPGHWLPSGIGGWKGPRTIRLFAELFRNGLDTLNVRMSLGSGRHTLDVIPTRSCDIGGGMDGMGSLLSDGISDVGWSTSIGSASTENSVNSWDNVLPDQELVGGIALALLLAFLSSKFAESE